MDGRRPRVWARVAPEESVIKMTQLGTEQPNSLEATAIAVAADGPGMPARAWTESAGIEVIPEPARVAKPHHLFWPWFGANVSVFGISYGSYVLGFGISFWQAGIVALIGVVFSFLVCGVIAVAGKRSSTPTMTVSRAAFGVDGARLPGLIGWLALIGWQTSLAVVAVGAVRTVFEQLSWSTGVLARAIAVLVIVALIVLGATAGYHILIRVQSILTWLLGVGTISYLLMTLGYIDWGIVAALPSGSPQAMIGAMTMVMTGLGLGWVHVAADWSRYQSRTTSDRSVIGWTTLGGSIAPAVLIVFGLLLAGSSPQLSTRIGENPVGALAGLLASWFMVPFLLTVVLSLICAAANGLYSSSLTLLSLGVRVGRPAAALIGGALVSLGAVFIVFFSPTFIGPFQSLLLTLGVPLSAWAGIMCADVVLRNNGYDEAALFQRDGRYASIDWISVATLLLSTVVGWGLVINTFAETAAWNNWQGYLLGPIGGRDGQWGWANLGVIVALLLGFLVTLLARRGVVARQEKNVVSQVSGAASEPASGHDALAPEPEPVRSGEEQVADEGAADEADAELPLITTAERGVNPEVAPEKPGFLGIYRGSRFASDDIPRKRVRTWGEADDARPTRAMPPAEQDELERRLEATGQLWRFVDDGSQASPARPRRGLVEESEA